jgi:hypothetical protein
MAAIWQDIEIEWQGETYRVKPTLKLINHVEAKPGRSITAMLTRLSRGDLPAGAACELIADVLQFAGAEDVDAEDVFAEVGGVSADSITLCSQILTALLPEPKSSPSGESGKKKTSGGKSRKPTGAKPTDSQSQS